MKRSLLVAVFLAGCPDETVSLPDGSARDASPDTGARPDAGPDASTDSGPTDTGGIDAGRMDAAMDATVMDADLDAGDDDASADAGAMPCTMDADCAPSGWCRADEQGVMTCVPWAEEGEYCSGFVPPSSLERCDPSGPAQCNAFVFIPDAPGICSVAATVAQLLANPMTYDGHVVNVASSYTVEKNRTCTPAMPCNMANACSAEEHLGDTLGAANTVLLAASGIVPFACAGNECDYTQNCPYALDAHVVVTGTFHDQSPPVIEVLNINDAF